MIPIIDLFAGPGGLGEGFSALRDKSGRRVFSIALSIERDSIAHQTLLLRSFFRQFPDKGKPPEYYQQIKNENVDWKVLASKYPRPARKAEAEVWRAELGGKEFPPNLVDKRIRKALGRSKDWVLIGGPPCQVYSQVGRSRIKGESAWHFARDKRHLLYKEYLRIIEVHKPPIFVMENVKGLLSSKKAGKRIIQQIVSDLENPCVANLSCGGTKSQTLGYTLHSLATDLNSISKRRDNGSPAKYIIRSEEHGIPQARHRVIIVGVRNDIQTVPKIIPTEHRVGLWDAIQDLPKLRSRLSNGGDSGQAWAESIQRVFRFKMLRRGKHGEVRKRMQQYSKLLTELSTGGEFVADDYDPQWMRDWFFDECLSGYSNHKSRSHIPEDLWRYFYASCFAINNHKSPVLEDFPRFLLPKHRNANLSNGESIFADRFRVQVKNRPSTTITSHISKDGHYFIHPDPAQCRSLTVREAARLQTFPDNYFFMGPRTSQYQQVGNAVPPLLAHKIAGVISQFFKEKERSTGGR